MTIPRRRAGVAACLISADLYGGKLRLHGIRICASRAEAEQLLAESEESGDSSYSGLFVAEPWIEEHDA
jgi:hypothetical protein